MEIVPIIYTALIVVIVLAFIVVSFSYYKNQKREKGTDLKDENITKMPIEIPVPISIHKRDEKIIPVKKKVDQKIKKTTEKRNLRKIAVSKEQKNIREKEVKKVFRSNKRVKILNIDNENINPQKKRLTRTANLDKKGKAIGSLGMDVLDKYSDENATDLFSINVSEQIKKPKPK